MIVGIRAWLPWFVRKDSVTCKNLISDTVVCYNTYKNWYHVECQKASKSYLNGIA